MKKGGNHQKSAVGNKPLSISTLNLFISYLPPAILVSLKPVSPPTHIHPALKPNSALRHCLLVFLFWGDQIFYRSYVDRQHFHLRSFASLCSTVVKKKGISSLFPILSQEPVSALNYPIFLSRRFATRRSILVYKQ